MSDVNDHGMNWHLSRRSLLGRAALLGASLPVVGLLASCGGDDDDDVEAAATSTPSSTGDEAATEQPSDAATEGTGDDDRSKREGGRLVVARSLDADGYDPHQSSQVASSQVFIWVIDTLVSVDTDRSIVPGNLAEGWEISDDALEYTWKLRQGITFHDGTPFNAEAVKFTFERSLGPIENPNSGDLGDIVEFEVLDEFTLRYRMSEPFAAHLMHLTSSYHGILSPTGVEQHGDQGFMQHPVGSGPFMFKEWLVDERVTLSRFEDYKNFRPYRENQGAPYLEELVFQRIPEEQTQLVGLEVGDVHVVAMPGQQMSRFENNDDFQLIEVVSRNLVYLNIVSNLEGDDVVYPSPVDDVRVRQALNYAFNAQEIIDRVLGGLAVPNQTPMVAEVFAYDPDSLSDVVYDFSVERAEELLDEAGWTMGSGGVRERDGEALSLDLLVTSTTTNGRIAQALQSQFQAVGVQINIEALESATFVERTRAGEFHLSLSSYAWFEPFILHWLVTLDRPGISYYAKYNPEADELLTAANGTPDQAERTKFYSDAQRLILADAAMIPLWSTISMTGARAEVKNLKPDPAGNLDYQDAYLDG